MMFEEQAHFTLLAFHYPDLFTAFDWMKQIFNQSEVLPKCVVIRSQQGISTLITQTSFYGETISKFRKREKMLFVYVLHEQENKVLL